MWGADAFETTISEPPYQRARMALEARRELHAGAGRQFDPMVVRTFARALRQLTWDAAQQGVAR